MGASRQNYPDEEIARAIHNSLPGLMILLWANHSYDKGNHFTEDILENIGYLKEKIQVLEDEVKKEQK